MPKRYTTAQMRAYMAVRRSRIKQQMLDLLGNRCSQCGSQDNLEFDHIDRASKSFEISGRGLDKPRLLLLEEVQKCQLLCKPHHIEKTVAERASVK